ncbi:hypothetical protein VZG28_05145 [Synechococcus elongatus IITB4]|uniref:hypothetical protein n=1 Tax=Synechococcus elongatus TaxID=32046 RepID=UPI0030CDBCE5
MDDLSRGEDYGLTIEQELVLHQIHDRIRSFSRAELMEAVLWAWQQVLVNKNSYLSLAVAFGATVEDDCQGILILPSDAPIFATEEEIRAIEAVEGPLGYWLDDGDDDDDESAGVLR